MEYTTLEQYLRDEIAGGKIDFRLRATTDELGRVVSVYVHPMARPGETTPTLVVKGNLVVLR